MQSLLGAGRRKNAFENRSPRPHKALEKRFIR